ncbi:MAG: molybdate ABC transporter permease subunit [Bacteroidota bacterium]
MNWTPLWLTLQLALVTTILLFFIALPLSYWLAHTRKKVKPVVETLVSMPLVLPPTVLGFYMLLAFSPANEFGAFLDQYFKLRLVFSFEGLVLGSILYSLPFMVHPIQSGFAQLPTSIIDAAYVLGKSKWQTLWQVQLSNMRASLLTAIVLSFAHTIGEFGVVLMIGGNIEGQTKVASIAIYDEVESLNYAAAHQYALLLFLFSFLVLFLVYWRGGQSLKYFQA